MAPPPFPDLSIGPDMDLQLALIFLQQGIASGLVSGSVYALLALAIVFFVAVRGLFKGSERQRKLYAAQMEANKGQ